MIEPEKQQTEIATSKSIGFWEKVICRFRNPLASIPECKHLVSTRESLKYGFDSISHRFIAENLVMGVAYAVHSAVPGDIAEFGTHTGRTARVVSRAMRLYRANKSLHLFDSFEGLPEATAAADLQNVHVKAGIWGQGALKGIFPEQLHRQCAKQIGADSVRIYKGWFSETLPKIPAGTKFSMVHIDSDLYLSAHEVLDFLFRNRSVSGGAMILFDDWQCNRASNEFGERRAWKEVVERHKVEAENMGCYGWGGHKFIVHSYRESQ
jgi:O-methyltransferase